MAFLVVRKGEEVYKEAAYGDGPVHAACVAVETITQLSGRLETFDIRANTPGKDAMGEAWVTVSFEGETVKGNGASTDIVEAAVKAYLNAINKYLALRQ